MSHIFFDDAPSSRSVNSMGELVCELVTARTIKKRIHMSVIKVGLQSKREPGEIDEVKQLKDTFNSGSKSNKVKA